MGTIFGVHNRLHITAGMLLSSYLIIARTSSIQNGKLIQFNKPTLLRFKFNRNDRIQKKKTVLLYNKSKQFANILSVRIHAQGNWKCLFFKDL